MKKDRASAIIEMNGGLVVIKRIKGIGNEKVEYYTIPGGGKEEGETIEEATIREITEELGIQIELTDKCYQFESQERMQYFFVAKYISGSIDSGIGDEMNNINYEKYGSYIPMIVPKDEIKDVDLRPAEIKELILQDFDIIFK